MEKKYELIKDEDGLIRIRALKDFILITGETVKNGDIGGCVNSEKCLSQEGNCWIMDYAYVSGKASENAVVKDCGFVGPNATVTGNAVVQAYQHITYGTVTTDLLGTKDWTDALYAEFGIVPKDGKVTLYKAVWSTDNPTVFKSIYNDDFLYEIGKYVVETDVDENVMNECGKGLHFTTLERTKYHNGNMIIKCEIDIEDIITVQFATVRIRKCRVISVLWS